MKLGSFSVRNYRSIGEAYKLSLGNYTVLVGPNNEGKSNILKAIAISLGLLTRARAYRRTRTSPWRFRTSRDSFDYDWNRDFPVALQGRFPNGTSEFTLEFQLTADEFDKFREQVGVNLGTDLKIKLFFGTEDPSFDILMKGKGKKTLNTRREQVVEFLRQRISAQYISALRPSEIAIEIVDSLIQQELYRLEEDPKYKSVLEQLKVLQKPILDKIAQKLTTSVSAFVPAVKSIEITNDSLNRSVRTSVNIMVDDGANTALASKGDGIISLATMSLMKHVSEEGQAERSLILSIEEPESHLHPEAIHGLRQVLKDISRRQQVIITTHSPILVEREQIAQNILVRGGRAEKAKQIEQIRDALGLQLADNLVGAYLVLLVEGDEDRDILQSWLSATSAPLRSALTRRILIVDDLAGGTNLCYKASFYTRNVCNVHVFVDNDEVGRDAIQLAESRNLIQAADYNLATCQGMANSEIEDLVAFDVYKEVINTKYGVSLQQDRFRNSRHKWSDRVRDCFVNCGKPWDDAVKRKVKRGVADIAVSKGIDSLNTNRRGPIDALVTSLEAKLASRG